jgi:hypothetical protein
MDVYSALGYRMPVGQGRERAPCRCRRQWQCLALLSRRPPATVLPEDGWLSDSEITVDWSEGLRRHRDSRQGLNVVPKLAPLRLWAATAKMAAPKKEGNDPFPAYPIIGNIYYVGASDITSYLITTPSGHILINTGFENTPKLIRDGIVKLGFEPWRCQDPAQQPGALRPLLPARQQCSV